MRHLSPLVQYALIGIAIAMALAALAWIAGAIAARPVPPPLPRRKEQ